MRERCATCGGDGRYGTEDGYTVNCPDCAPAPVVDGVGPFDIYPEHAAIRPTVEVERPAKAAADGGEILSDEAFSRLCVEGSHCVGIGIRDEARRSRASEAALRAEVKRLKAEHNRARADGYKRGAEDARRIWAKDADIEAHNKLLSSALSDEVREHMDDNRKLRAALDTATRALREIAATGDSLPDPASWDCNRDDREEK